MIETMEKVSKNPEDQIWDELACKAAEINFGPRFPTQLPQSFLSHTTCLQHSKLSNNMHGTIVSHMCASLITLQLIFISQRLFLLTRTSVKNKLGHYFSDFFGASEVISASKFSR